MSHYKDLFGKLLTINSIFFLLHNMPTKLQKTAVILRYTIMKDVFRHFIFVKG